MAVGEQIAAIRHRDPVDFERHRRTLFGVAYRMLGSADDAEDMVQDAWIRYARAAEPQSPRAYLISVVTRLCLDYLKSARVRREQDAGPWLPEPLATGEYASSPEQRIAEAESVSYAFMVLLERLSPLERAVFVLHDVLDYGHDEIATALGRSPATCRQLLSRARRHVRDGEARYRATPAERAELTQRFIAAAGRDVAGFVAMLTADAVLTSDGGGKVAAAMRPPSAPVASRSSSAVSRRRRPHPRRA